VLRSVEIGRAFGEQEHMVSKTIVTGVDGSETAAEAARTAAELALALGAKLIVLSAFGKLEVERFTSGSEEFVLSNEKDAQQIADDTVARLHVDFPDIPMEAEAAEGKPAEALLRLAERESASLIVVGNKRVQGVARVLGSVARDVAQHASCDVYIAYTHQR